MIGTAKLLVKRHLPAILVSAVIIVCFATLPRWNSHYPSLGTIDFIQYWSSFQLYQEGKNFYDPTLLLQIERSVGYNQSKPMMMWLGPWAMVLLKPILSADFNLATRLWFILNIFFCLGAGALTWAAVSAKDNLLVFSLVAAMMFFPTWATLQYGQISLLVAFGAAGFFWALSTRRYFLAGLFAVLLTLKPHLFYLVIIVCAWWIISERQWKIVYSFFLFFGVLLLVTFFDSPQAIYYWVDSLVHPPEGAVNTSQWKVATLVGFVRVMLEKYFDIHTFIPSLLIPSATAICVLWYLIIRRPTIVWATLFPPLLCLSLATSFYGWMFDQSLLLILQIAILGIVFEDGISSKRRSLILLSLFILQCVAYIHSHFALYLHELFWFPLVMLLIWWFARWDQTKPI